MNKLCYLGNFEPYFSTENDIKKSFESLGWEVCAFQESVLDDKMIDNILEAMKDCKFLLYTRTWTRSHVFYLKLIKGVHLLGKKCVSVHLDLYLGLDRGEFLKKKQDSFFLSDYVFSADGGKQDEFKKLGINHFWFQPAVLESSCYFGKPVEKYKSKVAFVGSYHYHKEWPYRKMLIDWLARTYGKDFKLWGATELVRGDDLNNLYASADIVVGDSTYSPFYWSDRVPETTGRGGFLIHPHTEGLDEQYPYYKALIPYDAGDFTQLKEIIDYFLANPAERQKVKEFALENAKKKHTYKIMCQYVIDTLKEYGEI